MTDESLARKTPPDVSSRFQIPVAIVMKPETALPLTAEERENLLNMRRDVIAFLRRLDEFLGLEQTIQRRKR